MNDPTCDLPDFVQFVENADEIIFVLTQEGLISYISPNCARMLGYDPGEVIGVSAVEFIHPDDLPKNRESFLQTLTLGKNTRGIQFRIRHKKWDVAMEHREYVPHPRFQGSHCGDPGDHP